MNAFDNPDLFSSNNLLPDANSHSQCLSLLHIGNFTLRSQSLLLIQGFTSDSHYTCSLISRRTPPPFSPAHHQEAGSVPPLPSQSSASYWQTLKLLALHPQLPSFWHTSPLIHYMDQLPFTLGTQVSGWPTAAGAGKITSRTVSNLLVARSSESQVSMDVLLWGPPPLPTALSPPLSLL